MGGTFNEYNERGFFWGSVLIALKLSIAFLGSLPTIDLKTKAMTIFLILFTVVNVLEKLSPYNNKEI